MCAVPSKAFNAPTLFIKCVLLVPHYYPRQELSERDGNTAKREKKKNNLFGHHSLGIRPMLTFALPGAGNVHTLPEDFELFHAPVRSLSLSTLPVVIL